MTCLRLGAVSVAPHVYGDRIIVFSKGLELMPP